MTTYCVDKSLMEDYIKSLDKRRAIVFIIMILVAFLLQGFIAYNLDNDFPFWVIIIAAVVIAVAFYFSLRLANDQLKQLSGGSFYLDKSILKFIAADNLIRQFNLDEIAVIHKKYSGTMVVKGNGWTKFNYIRPKKSAYQVMQHNVIFIPTITSNYVDLVDKIEQTAKNAMKL